ncbi:MAG: anti-sigma factor [Lewinellaceae bacterium]|nr:anti-sigma factor [Lewinellaceae bacterium]
MDIKAYIASGILEQYVLGNLSPREEAEVEQYAGQYPEVRQEIDDIERTLEEYAMLNGKVPPPGVLTATLQRMHAEKMFAPRAGRGSRWRALAIVEGLLLLAAIAGLLLLSQKARQQQAAQARLLQQMDTLQQNCDSIQAYAGRLEDNIEFLKQPSTRQVIMRGTGLAPDAVATVFYNPELRQNLLSIGRMPSPPSDKQYQLWAIVAGQPVDMGVFDLSSEAGALIAVPFLENPQAFAVTLEERGGSPAPTLDQMYVIGNT